MAKNNNTLYEETLELVVESCYNPETKSFDWEEYKRFCDSNAENLWYDED